MLRSAIRDIGRTIRAKAGDGRREATPQDYTVSFCNTLSSMRKGKAKHSHMVMFDGNCDQDPINNMQGLTSMLSYCQQVWTRRRTDGLKLLLTCGEVCVSKTQKLETLFVSTVATIRTDVVSFGKYARMNVIINGSTLDEVRCEIVDPVTVVRRRSNWLA